MSAMKNSELLQDFVRYCEQNPEQRFWQALRNWSGASIVSVTEKIGGEPKDTYYFEGKQP